MFDKIRKIRRYAKGEILVSRKMTVSEILLRRLGTSEAGAQVTQSRIKADKKSVIYH